MNTETLGNRIHYIYRITNRINGKIYIGQTVDYIRRWYEHKRDAKRENPTMVITCAIKKYGASNFDFDVIAACKTWDDANETETLLVSQYDSHIDNDKGYNVSFGGYNAPKSEQWKAAFKAWHASLSPEERAKISKQQSDATIKQIAEKGHPAAGRIVSDAEKELHRQFRLDNPINYTPELRQKMSESHIGNKDTEETKAKKSDSAKEAWAKRIDYSRKCEAPGCDVNGKAAYKMIEGVRYCNKHGLRLLRYGRLTSIR